MNLRIMNFILSMFMAYSPLAHALTDKQNILYQAAMKGDDKLVSSVLSTFEDSDIVFYIRDNYTILDAAIQSSNMSVITVLLNSIYAINLLRPNNDGIPSLKYAIEMNKVSAVEAILNSPYAQPYLTFSYLESLSKLAWNLRNYHLVDVIAKSPIYSLLRNSQTLLPLPQSFQPTQPRKIMPRPLAMHQLPIALSSPVTSSPSTPIDRRKKSKGKEKLTNTEASKTNELFASQKQDEIQEDTPPKKKTEKGGRRATEHTIFTI